MIRKASEITASTVEGFKGGKGALISRDIRSAEELAPHGRKFGYSILPPDEQDFSAYFTNSEKKVLYHFAGVRLGIQY